MKTNLISITVDNEVYYDNNIRSAIPKLNEIAKTINTKVIDIQVDTFKQSLEEITSKLITVFDSLPESEKFSPSEITVNLAISSTGEFSLLGTIKSSTQNSSGVSIKFQRKP